MFRTRSSQQLIIFDLISMFLCQGSDFLLSKNSQKGHQIRRFLNITKAKAGVASGQSVCYEEMKLNKKFVLAYILFFCSPTTCYSDLCTNARANVHKNVWSLFINLIQVVFEIPNNYIQQTWHEVKKKIKYVDRYRHSKKKKDKKTNESCKEQETI